MADGSVGLVVDIASLIEHSVVSEATRAAQRTARIA
jgi:hypothetical protein